MGAAVMDTKDLDSQMSQRRRIAALKAKVGLWEAPGKGWHTMDAIAKQMGLGNRAAQYTLKPWIEKGMVEIKSFRIQNRVIACQVPHYKLHPAVAKAYGIK